MKKLSIKKTHEKMWGYIKKAIIEGGPMTQTELNQTEDLRNYNIGRLLQQLERDGKITEDPKTEKISLVTKQHYVLVTKKVEYEILVRVDAVDSEQARELGYQEADATSIHNWDEVDVDYQTYAKERGEIVESIKSQVRERLLLDVPDSIIREYALIYRNLGDMDTLEFGDFHKFICEWIGVDKEWPSFGAKDSYKEAFYREFEQKCEKSRINYLWNKGENFI